jgi:response regulator RpfG family c-di-GMP phosphodiesterase
MPSIVAAPPPPPARLTELAPIPPDIRVLNPKGNRELILLVDDETEISEIASEMLAEEGYKIILAKDGFEALRIYQQSARRWASSSSISSCR